MPKKKNPKSEKKKPGEAKAESGPLPTADSPTRVFIVDATPYVREIGVPGRSLPVSVFTDLLRAGWTVTHVSAATKIQKGGVDNQTDTTIVVQRPTR